ncbi:hypothetical protein JK364_23595 [Streptomyces sp. 110]|uniref:Uncharacterized protein n=1 Tax=Streptomyces endocoffeicus TaxID=2898945 RepID=A0ABS1PSF2_9ACTN|nr:hypothetical protein [Streptomyces endocoffeicus]MBL1115358.1 hypothetical protein [Streptomyces endocoffeicus]
MTVQIPIEPARPHGPLQSLPDWSFSGAGMGGLFTCYCIDLAVRLYREHQTQQAEAPEAVPA